MELVMKVILILFTVKTPRKSIVSIYQNSSLQEQRVRFS